MIMASFVFGRTSAARLATCDLRLQRIAHHTLETQVMDFTVICGARTLETQAELYKQGRFDSHPGSIVTNVDGVRTRSKHNASPSLALDLAPYYDGQVQWEDRQAFCVLAGIMLSAAAHLGHALRWGGDWDRDGNTRDQDLVDLPHFELLI